MSVNERSHTLQIDEGERQMLLLAMGFLAVQRPGWDEALTEIAKRIDNVTPEGKAQLYEQFKELRRESDKLYAEGLEAFKR